MASDLHSRISRRLRTTREERGLSQEQLSQHLGFNDCQTLSAIENGTRRIAP